MQPYAIIFAGIGVAKLTVAVVGERHVSGTLIIKLFYIPQICPYWVGIFNSYHGNFLSWSVYPFHVIGTACQFYLFGGVFFNEPVYGVKFIHGIFIRFFIAFFIEISLTCIDDQPGYVESALFHLWQINLGVQILRVVDFVSKIFYIDIIMRIDGDDRFMNLHSPLHHTVFTLRWPCLCDDKSWKEDTG